MLDQSMNVRFQSWSARYETIGELLRRFTSSLRAAVRLLCSALLIIAPAGASSDATASARKPVARATTTGASSVCSKLTSDITNHSKSLAANFAEGVGDNSAPRATMRETQEQTILANVRMTMDLMRDNRCKLPTSVPNGGEYIGSALQCKTDRLKAEVDGTAGEPAACNQSKWLPE